MTMLAESPLIPDPEGEGHLHVPSGLLVPEIVAAAESSTPIWGEATDVEAQVFIDAGYVDSKEELAQEYAPYLSRTTMAALIRSGEVVGATRVSDRVFGAGTGFKTLNDIAAGRLALDERGRRIVEAMDLDKTQEVGTIALKEEFRGAHGFKLAGWLYEYIYDRAVDRGYDNVIASFDARYFAGFAMRFRPAVTALGPAMEYMGSPTIPAHINVHAVDPSKFH